MLCFLIVLLVRLLFLETASFPLRFAFDSVHLYANANKKKTKFQTGIACYEFSRQTVDKSNP